MKILKSYKYRLYPNQEQSKYLTQVFGCVRFVWNKLVDNFNSYSTHGPNKPLNEKMLKDDSNFPWLKDSISYALQQKRNDFEEFKKQFFNKKRKKKIERPRFKKKGIARDSFRIPGQQIGYNKAIDFENNTIKITKVGKVKLVIDREFKGQLKSITVSKNKCDQYFVSVLVEDEIEQKQNTGQSIGIDLGLKDLLTLSNGDKIKNPRWFRENQTKLKRAQLHLSRKKKGSNRYNKQRLKVAKIHLKISNTRSWVYHNISSWLVNNFDNIIMEDLNVAGMKKMFGKSISDAAFSELVKQIEYKCTWYGKIFHKIDRFYPSSKTCSCCGYKLNEFSLNIREWKCPECDINHDRDLNAATNILVKGLNDLYQFTSDELADYRRREKIRPRELSSKGILVETSNNLYDFL